MVPFLFTNVIPQNLFLKVVCMNILLRRERDALIISDTRYNSLPGNNLCCGDSLGNNAAQHENSFTAIAQLYCSSTHNTAELSALKTLAPETVSLHRWLFHAHNSCRSIAFIYQNVCFPEVAKYSANDQPSFMQNIMMQH